MARITVEDCIERIENRFELVMLAARRSRQLALGRRDPLVPGNDDKPTVLALREIADGLVDAGFFERDEQREADEALFGQGGRPLRPVIEQPQPAPDDDF